MPHRLPKANEIPISKPGSYAEAGATYILTKNITSPASTIFLGKDVTLDLNGYTIKYADANYQHIYNSGFEEGVNGWNISKAPGAKVVNTKDVHVFIGKKILSLKAGDEITSPYVNLSLANRSYFAMCGVTGFDYKDMHGDLNNQMKVSVYVEDEHGNEVRCITKYSDTTMVSCPVENKAPRLGGGFVYAHLNHLPAGKYRVRVKAITDCFVDEIDIRPAMDVGIGIVEKTYAKGHYDHLFNSEFAAFFDYTKDVSSGTPVESVPGIQGEGNIVIKNGVIESGSVGIVSWGIQSTAKDVKIILENLKIKTSGINAIAADIPQATITHCSFEVDNPFIINRHYANFYAVDLRGDAPSEVSYCDFNGGQGCLSFMGNKSSIHHNHFVNRQMITNHYSIMAMGDSSKIFENNIEPETGSGIEIYVHRHIEIFNNIFNIKTSPPTCEYGHEEYSTAAVRMADYRAKPGSKSACFGNKVYGNKIFITANGYPDARRYTPMCWGIYYSASGGDNDIFGNEIVINKTDLSSKALTAAFYICGGIEGFGGRFYNNRITTNVPAAWVASFYGGTINTKIYSNTIIKSATANAAFKPFKMGWTNDCTECIAKNIEFRSNNIENAKFEVDASNQDHSYTVYWTLTVKVTDANRNAVKNADITIRDKNNNVVLQTKTDANGHLQTELREYEVNGKERKFSSPYIITTGSMEKKVELNRDTEIILSK
ncbi:MAG: carboxypeptidase regulatory-like domain-containing protein [Bacteroidetes bacterium]|nr:carboxypeptidase regulatory-like domain-containing protein [Bacteroidota bacterium]